MGKAKRLAAGALLAAVALSPVRSYAWGIDWSDTFLSYRYLAQDKQPGYRGNVVENAGNIAYANGWTYGSNFVSLDFEDFGHQDPANVTDFSGHQKAGSHSFETYSVFRTTLSGNKIFGGDSFKFGPIRDVGLEIGGDLDTQDDQFASYKRLLVAGPQFSIAIPKGFWSITLAVSKEWNTDAYLPNDNGTNYDPTWLIETAWLYPFNVGPVPLKFTGFINVIGPKGYGATGDFYHRTEILAHPKLMVDVGSLIGYAPNKIDAGVGFEYWHNKFGSVKQYVSGTQQDAFFFEVGYHF